MVDPRGKAARDARMRLRVCGRARADGLGRVSASYGVTGAGFVAAAELVAERAATDEEDDGCETGQHERADEASRCVQVS